MAKSFTVIIREDPEELLERVRRKASKGGVNFWGDSVRGGFSGKVSGSYSISGNQLTITITKKPFIVSWGFVKSEIRKFFG